MPRHNNYNDPTPDPIDEKLMRLGALKQLNTPQDDTANLVKMLAELYGISAAQQMNPEQIALTRAHANYYNTQTNEFANTAQSRALQNEAESLYKLFGNVPPDFADQAAGRMGYHRTPPPVPPGEAGVGDLIPKEYANDPEFQNLNSFAQKRQGEKQKTQGVDARTAALEKLKRSLGIPTPDRPSLVTRARSPYDFH